MPANLKNSAVATGLEKVSFHSSTKEIFHAKMGTIKDRNFMDLTETEDIKKSWQEYTKELYKKKILMTQITTMV